jgi:hypothetical protein
MRFLATGIGLIFSFFLWGCVGPISLHQAVLGYDEATSRLDREILLLNIGRTHQNLPTHFTVTSSIAATFDYRTNTGFSANLFENPGSNNSYGVLLGASAAENPTLSIVPIQGEEFSKRILAPMDESRFEFLVFQGAPLNMVLRLMARGIEVQNPDGTFHRFILNSPAVTAEYEEFRRVTKHLLWLNQNRKLFVGTLAFEQSLPLKGPPSSGEIMAALDKGYSLRRSDQQGDYVLARKVTGRVAITNYDPRTLNNKEREALNEFAGGNPGNFVLLDIRPGHPGGDFPIFGGIKMRSLNAIITFLAAGIDKAREYEVKADPRTNSALHDPAQALALEVTNVQPPDSSLSVSYGGKYYSVSDTPWDREAFKLLYSLFQMTVTDVSKIGVPVTIGK